MPAFTSPYVLEFLTLARLQSTTHFLILDNQKDKRGGMSTGQDVISMASAQMELAQTFTANTEASNGTRTKTLRLTENKRRYRARRKEYVSDLESRLAAAREQGVQASKEVQLAAQQVAIRNTRLRDLLSLAGFSADEVDYWESTPGCVDADCGKPGDDRTLSPCVRQRRLLPDIEQKARRCAAALASAGSQHQGGGDLATAGDLATPLSQVADSSEYSGWGQTPPHLNSRMSEVRRGSEAHAFKCNSGITTAHTTPIPITDLLTTTPEHNPVPEPTGKKNCGTSTCHIGNIEKKVPILPTCKLLTRLAENPAADITQVPDPDTSSLNANDGLEEDVEADAGESNGGKIECRKAYDMLIQYATTEEKMDTIARALESGCTKSGNGKGGCAVRSEVILQALDSVCR